MLLFVSLSLFVVVQSFASSEHSLEFINKEWKAFKREYQKSYSTIEEKFRFKIFAKNLFKYYKHNVNFRKGKLLYEIGINQFSDMSRPEIEKITQSYVKSPKNANFPIEILDYPTHLLGRGNSKPPEEKDWVKEGVVTSVKSQGECGSCWAFVVAGVLESSFVILKNKKLQSLSPQQLIDCSSIEYGSQGCKGGTIVGGCRYVGKNGGIEIEAQYPYKGKENRSCNYNKRYSAGTIKQLGRIRQGDVSTLMDAVINRGPVAVAIDASKLHPYKSGIFAPTNCSSENVNHGVLLVGYGNDHSTNQSFWKLKNSWGAKWGEDGYFRMKRENNKNICGIATDASIPTDVA